MSKTILLIENDAAFARPLTEALEGAGFTVRRTGDGKEGLDLAREIAPAAIVLCVELPRMSGYSICQKLKKDDALRAIPLVLTSAEATAETFEQHRKLKARAEEYLVKPYAPAALLEKLGALVGLPEPHALAEHDEEVVSLEEDVALESLTAPAEGLPALDLGSLPDEPLAGGGAPPGGEDEDLRLLDDAFDGISRSPPAGEVAADAGAALDVALGGERPIAVEEVDAAASSLPEEDDRTARDALGDVADEADLALGALGGDDTAGAALDALVGPAAQPDRAAAAAPPAIDLEPELAAALGLEPERPAAAVRGASAEALRAAGIALLDDARAAAPPPPDGAELGRLEADLAERRAAVAARDAEIAGLGERLAELGRRAEAAEAALARRDADVAGLEARAGEVSARLERAEAGLGEAREQARRDAERLAAAEERAAAAEERARAAEERAAGADEARRAAEARAEATLAEADGARTARDEARRELEARTAELAEAAAAAARLAEVEREVERLETELVVARGEVEGARAEVENRTGEMRKRLAELEAASAKNEERVVKAYLKIKGDEKVRDRTRKALAVALQLLEEGLPAEGGDKPRAPPAPAAKLD